MSHSISLDKAVEMTQLYRENREEILEEQYKNLDILARSETFAVDAILSLIADSNVKKVRIYYGMDSGKKVHAIMVGADKDDNDILPEVPDEPSYLLVEQSIRCPTMCPPSSVLNTD